MTAELHQKSRQGWLVGRLTSPFSIKIGYIEDKVLDGEFHQVNDGQRYNDTVTSRPR